jgi:hypothetical protein
VPQAEFEHRTLNGYQNFPQESFTVMKIMLLIEVDEQVWRVPQAELEHRTLNGYQNLPQETFTVMKIMLLIEIDEQK